MKQELVQEIIAQTEILMHNVDVAILTCDMDFVLCGKPVWQHVYHMLHSLDRWFVNPECYEEPCFHEPGMNSLDEESEKSLTREELAEYFEGIKVKLCMYLGSLTDDMLCEKPEGCSHTRLALVLGQYRHLYCHLGNINCTTILQTGKWPRVVGLNGDRSGGLYE